MASAVTTSAADQLADLLAELDVFDQETEILSRQWEVPAVLPRGSIDGCDEETAVCGARVDWQEPAGWDRWHVLKEARVEVQPASSRYDFSERDRDCKSLSLEHSGNEPAVWERERGTDEYRVVQSRPVLVEHKDGDGEAENVALPSIDLLDEAMLKSDGEAASDTLEKAEALVRPKKAAFSFAKAARFSDNPDPTTTSSASETARNHLVTANQESKPATAAPSFAKAPPRKTIIEELIEHAKPTNDLVYEPEYKLVHKRVPGASFGKVATAPKRKKGQQGTDSRPEAEQTRHALEGLSGNSGDTVASTVNENTGGEKSTLGPGFYNVEVKLVQKRAPAVGFATLVPREQSANDAPSQQLTLDVTSALGAVSKRVKGVVGFGAGPARFVNEDDKENGKKPERLQLQPKYEALEPRVKGALPYKKPLKSALSPESSQLLTSRSTSSFGTASPVDTPRGVLTSPDPSLLLPRHPAWKFSPPPQKGAPPKQQIRPPQKLSPRETLVRRRTEGVVEFGRAFGRGKKEETVTMLLKQAKQLAPGQYSLAQAWRHLQRHIPAAAFGAMAKRWADASLSSETGVRTVLEELSAAVALTRPRPPAWSFCPQKDAFERWNPDRRRSLDVQISFVRRRTAGALAFRRSEGDVRPRDLDRREYTLHFDLVEPSARVIDFRLGSERRLGSGEEISDGARRELDVRAGLEATRWRPPQMVPIAKQLGRPQPDEVGRADDRFMDPDADLVLKAHVPSVDMRAHADRWMMTTNLSDGPEVGAYDFDRASGADAPAVDFSLARGRELARRVKKRLEGDRLNLNTKAGWDAVKPSIPAVGFSPEVHQRERGQTELDYHDYNLELTKRRLLDVIDMSRMQAREEKDDGLPDGEKIAAMLRDYPLSDGLIRATVQVPGFARYRGHVAAGGRITEENQSVLEFADDLVRPHHWAVSDMDRMLGRREERQQRFHDVEYDTNNSALRPAVPSIRIGRQAGHWDGAPMFETGNLDGGCYDATRPGERRAMAVDFLSGPSRAILDPYEPALEGNNFLLPLHATEPADAARRRAPAAADFGRASDRWLSEEMALLDRAELGNNLLLRPDVSPTRKRAPEVDFSRDRPRWEWADARADAIELYGEGHFMELNPYEAAVQKRAPGVDFTKMEGRSAIEAREERRLLKELPRGPPPDHERVLEALKATRFNPPRTNFGQPPLPPIQESTGRGDAAERMFFDRLTKETRTKAMMERLKGKDQNPKPKRRIRVSGAVAVDLESMREGFLAGEGFADKVS